MKVLNKKNTRIMIITLIVIEMCCLFLMYKSFSNKSILDVVKLQENEFIGEMFAIMLEQDDGTYKESDSWPSSGYKYNSTKSGCIDLNGNKIEDALNFDASTNIASVDTGKTSSCYLYFDKAADIKISVSTDGVVGVLPTTSGYTNTLNCNDSTYNWNNIYQRVELSDVTSDELNCNLAYTKDTSSYTNLKSEVENKTTQNIATVPDYTNASILNQNEYGTTSQFSSTSNSSTSGTTVENAFTYSGTEWSSVPANLTSNKYYHLKFNILSEGYYQLCYTMSSGYSSNRLYVYQNETQLAFGTSSYLSASSSASKSGCIDIGELTTSDYIKVTQRAYSNSTYPIATVSFYLQKTLDVNTYDTGYRYTGKQPNNWVWFNKEKWRIIGSIPTKLSDGTTSNLVKIIRSKSIGGLVFHSAKSNTTWGNNALYDLLNNNYYGKKDKTGESPCLGYSDTAYALCNYSEIGISNDEKDYYGRMIKDVYWNVGTVNDVSKKIDKAYELEIATLSSISARIGLISASDYGYATSEITYGSVGLSSLNSYEEYNWLYGLGAEWTLTPYSSSNVIYVGNGGVISNTSAYIGHAVRPVMYLDSSVYIISGDGTEVNPYQIGI